MQTWNDDEYIRPYKKVLIEDNVLLGHNGHSLLKRIAHNRLDRSSELRSKLPVDHFSLRQIFFLTELEWDNTELLTTFGQALCLCVCASFVLALN